jgi:uncharacterized membrane protein
MPLSPAELPPGDGDLVAHLGILLRVGSIASALVILAGGVVYLLRHGTEPMADLATFKPLPAEFARPGAILQAARAGRGRALVQLGLLLLIATPVLRVAYSVAAFGRRRDWLYAALTLTVLAVLLFGLFSGQPG